LASTSGFDRQILLGMVGNDPALLREVIDEFVLDAKAQAAEIGAAVSTGTAKQVKAAAHKLKGSASVVGAHQLVEVCTQLQAAAEKNDWPMISRLVPVLNGAILHIEASAKACSASQPDALP
jgi:HPt (histidine-containing phosphotransfer) domain-containing protein